jgi:hypothetical protein
MGSWDEVCIVCGISPGSDLKTSGPCWLLTKWGGWREKHVPKVSAEVVAVIDADFDETLAIVSEAFSLDFYEDYQAIHRLRDVMPGLGDWSGFKRCMAIGQFDSDGGATQIDDESGSFRVPNGRQVVVRLVEDYSCPNFGTTLKVVEGDAKEDWGEFVYSHCSAFEGNPNFFVSEGCYHYLHAWIDWAALPPRKQAFPLDPAPLPFGAELYEIVNSKEDLRGE